MLLRDYFKSFNFYKNDELSRNLIGRSGVQVKKENEKFIVVRSRSPQMWLFHVVVLQRTAKKCTKMQNERAERLFFLIKPVVLKRCRCRHRRRCLSSLIISYSGGILTHGRERFIVITALAKRSNTFVQHRVCRTKQNEPT